jgi:pyridoxine 5'-phosphate synthase PdxJ
MARQFGIITTTTGITGIVVNSLTTSNSAEIAEARDENGKITDLKAYSKAETISVSGLLDGSIGVQAGAKLTLNSVDYIIESVEISETNTGYTEVSLTARTADSAAIAPYAAEEAAAGE